MSAPTDATQPTLSAETKSIVAETVPVLEAHGLAITARLYERLFNEHPQVERLFSGTGPGQPERLAGAVLAYAQNIETVEEMLPAVEAIAAKHVAAGVLPSHYDIVGTTLLASMVDVLGGVDISVIDAWSEAYEFLANIFIGVEAEMAGAA